MISCASCEHLRKIGCIATMELFIERNGQSKELGVVDPKIRNRDRNCPHFDKRSCKACTKKKKSQSP
jgi:hypothetical protein